MENKSALQELEQALGRNFRLLEGSGPGEREFLVQSIGCIPEIRPDAQTIGAMAIFTQKSIAQELGRALERDSEATEIALELERIETVLRQDIDYSEKRKIVVAVCKDFRAIIAMLGIQLARAKNFQELGQAERKRQAQLAMNVFAPIAHKLGIYSVKALLEDFAFRELEPKQYSEIESKMLEKRPAIEKEIAEVIGEIGKKIGEKGWKERARVQARAKHVYSVWRKMQKKKIGISRVYDLVAVRIITKEVSDCYEILGMIHSLWRPLPGEFDDYIAKPKPNGYQSLHTAIIGPGRKPIEIQIRTEEMHLASELGIAAHWRYKGQGAQARQDKRLGWLKQALEWERDSSEEGARLDFFENQIYVFTPRGQVIELPEGATPIDFAYAVHSDIGNRCKKVRVNGKLVGLSTKLESADTVEIITSQKQFPKPSWLSIAVSQKALGRIRQALEVSGIQRKRAQAMKGKTEFTISSREKKVKLAKCCSPLPGDEVVGIKTTKRKVSVHRTDCENAGLGKKETLVKVGWGAWGNENYDAKIIVQAKEIPGILSKMLSQLSASGVRVVSSAARADNGINVCVFSVRVRDLKQLEKAVAGLEGIRGVLSAGRE